MKVRISYTVDLEQVPNETKRLLEEAASVAKDNFVKLEYLQANLDRYLVNLDNKDALMATLQDIRKKLAVIDSKVMDTSMIIDGFFQTMEEPPDTEITTEESNDVPEG